MWDGTGWPWGALWGPWGATLKSLGGGVVMRGRWSVLWGFLGVLCLRVPAGDNGESLGAVTAGGIPSRLSCQGCLWNVTRADSRGPWGLSLRCGAVGPCSPDSLGVPVPSR